MASIDWTPDLDWGDKQEARARELGMMSEQLSGRSMETFFEPAEDENLTYAFAKDVDFNKRTEIDTADMDTMEVNKQIRALMDDFDYDRIAILLGGDPDVD